MVERALSTSVARWTLVLSVLFGVLAMHALVLGRSDHPPAASAGPASLGAAHHTPAASAPVALGPAVHGSVTPAAASPVAGPPVLDRPLPHTDRPTAARPHTNGPVAALPHTGGPAALSHAAGPAGALVTTGSTDHGDGGGAPAGHDHGLLHLCLAVVTALAGAFTTLLSAQMLRPVRTEPGPGTGRVRRAATGPATRPPPSAVRLAQLCVLRT